MKCKICGKEIERSQYVGEVLCSGKCFTTNFWNETLDDEAIIINGVCYRDGGHRSNTSSCLLGHAGRLFKILMNDGRSIVTNNLWCNGSVPVERRVSDNAKFVFNNPQSRTLPY